MRRIVVTSVAQAKRFGRVRRRSIEGRRESLIAVWKDWRVEANAWAKRKVKRRSKPIGGSWLRCDSSRKKAKVCRGKD